MSVTRLFVPAVNATIGVTVALAAVACDVHHVSVMHEMRREREALCAARLEAVRVDDGTDKCAELSRLTDGAS